MKKILTALLLLSSILTAGIPTENSFYGPTEQLIKRESRHKIEGKLLKMHLPFDLFPFFDSIADRESWGHVGYHGASQKYRVYQDIVRLTIEEILDISIREDFHFLRVPGDPDLDLNSMKEFKDFWGKEIDNKDEVRAKQLLSLNFAIYGNFDNEGSCSLSLFVKNKSKDAVRYDVQLSPFFRELGISPTALTDLFAIGKKWFSDEGGILLQIKEHSHLTHPKKEAYDFLDRQGYPSKRGGYEYGSYPLSNHFERLMSHYYLEKKIEIAPQLRLLINNRNTLNPNSQLDIQRWDLYDTDTISQYEAEMRAFIRKLKRDPSKVEQYRNRLLKIWAKK